MRIHLFSRGPLGQVSGGYLYNRRLVDAMRRAGHQVSYHGESDDYDRVADGATCIVDGLVLDELAPRLDFGRHRVVLLLHMNPLRDGADEGDVRTALARARVVTSGDATREAVASLPGCDAGDVITIEPGVPPGWRRKTVYSQTAGKLLCVANYVAGKGHRRMIEALSTIDNADWSLRVFGNADLEPGCYDALQRFVSASDFASRVTLATATDQDTINTEMTDADLLLVFSREESYSMVTAEAIACGLPVLSHPTGQMRRFGQSGCVRYVDTLEPQRTVAALRSLLTDEEAYASLRPSGSTRPRSWEQVAAEFMEWLEQGR